MRRLVGALAAALLLLLLVSGAAPVRAEKIMASTVIATAPCTTHDCCVTQYRNAHAVPDWCIMDLAVDPSGTGCIPVPRCDLLTERCDRRARECLPKSAPYRAHTAILDTCTDDAYCDDGSWCTGTDACVDGVCIEPPYPCAYLQYCSETDHFCATPCTTNQDCATPCGGFICHPTLSYCQYTGDPICAPGRDCSNSCAPIACTTDAACDNGIFCDGVETCTGNVCTAGAPPCSQYTACNNEARLCDAGTPCILTGCENQCTGAYCNATTNGCDIGPPRLTCLPTETCDRTFGCLPLSCEVNASICDDGLFCNGVEICNATTLECALGSPPCNQTQFCIESNNTCVPRCDSAVCDNVCTGTRCSATTNQCVVTEAPLECPSHLTCYNPVGCVGVSCTTNADCTDSDVCNGLETCDQGVCAAGVLPCLQNETCVAGANDTYTCTASCTTDQDCSDGLFCNGPEVCNVTCGPALVLPCDSVTQVCIEANATCQTAPPAPTQTPTPTTTPTPTPLTPTSPAPTAPQPTTPPGSQVAFWVLIVVLFILLCLLLSFGVCVLAGVPRRRRRANM